MREKDKKENSYEPLKNKDKRNIKTESVVLNFFGNAKKNELLSMKGSRFYESSKLRKKNGKSMFETLIQKNVMSTTEIPKPRLVQKSKSAVEQARSIGYGVGSTAAGLAGAPGVIADLAGWFAANGAQDAVELTEQLARLAYDVRDRTERPRVELSLMARPYGRDEA